MIVLHLPSAFWTDLLFNWVSFHDLVRLDIACLFLSISNPLVPIYTNQAIAFVNWQFKHSELLRWLITWMRSREVYANRVFITENFLCEPELRELLFSWSAPHIAELTIDRLYYANLTNVLHLVSIHCKQLAKLDVGIISGPRHALQQIMQNNVHTLQVLSFDSYTLEPIVDGNEDNISTLLDLSSWPEFPHLHTLRLAEPFGEDDDGTMVGQLLSKCTALSIANCEADASSSAAIAEACANVQRLDLFEVYGINARNILGNCRSLVFLELSECA